MLATLPTLKLRLGLDPADVKDDALLTNFIRLVTARFENDCNRSFGYATVNEEFEGDETELRVSNYPIDQAQPITFQLMVSVIDGLQAMTNVEYVIRRNCIISLNFELGRWKNKLIVTYTGGFALPIVDVNGNEVSSAGTGSIPSTAPPLPDDISLVAVEQCVYWYQNKDRLGLVALSGQSSSIHQFSKLDLLPSVSATVKRYERWLS